MLLINPKYKGRFHSKAVELVRAGKRIGMMWISGETSVLCHVCHNMFTPPQLHEVHKDCMGECPNCKLTFIFAQP